MMPEILPNGNIRISIPVTIKTQGGRKRIVAKEVSRLTGCESPLVLNLARGFHWQELIDEGAYPNIKELAKAIGIGAWVVARGLRLTWLSPKIIHNLFIGEVDISMQSLLKSFPIVWRKQEEELL